MLNDPRYAPVEQVLPTQLPALTRQEASKAVLRILKHFGGKQHGSPLMVRPARNTYGRGCPDGVRRVWISNKPTRGSNHLKGWGRLIHDVSHDIFGQRHPNFRPHEGGQATLEREIAEYVVAQGWLTGELKPKPKAKPTAAEKRTRRIATIEKLLKGWYAKERRVKTAIGGLENEYRKLHRPSVVAVVAGDAEYPIFTIQSEHVQGERRLYWVERKDSAAAEWVSVSKTTTNRRRTERKRDELLQQAGRTGGG